MSDRWIIRVAGKEYGPVDLEALREWKREGRLLSANEARLESESQWSNAGAIPGLFQSMPLAPSQSQAKEIEQPPGKLFRRTFQIYGRGFFQFLALSGLVIVPSLCGQLVSVFAERLHSSGPNFLGFFSALLAFFMMVTLVVLWPVYLAGLQIVTGELAAGRRIGVRAALNRAAKFWPRVAILCLIVYGVFFLLLVFAFAIALTWHFEPLQRFVPTWLSDWLFPIDKTNLDVLRFAHFLALAAVTVRFVPQDWPGLKSPILSPAIRCGQHSLEIFCLGVFLAFAAHFVMVEFYGGTAMQVAMSAAGILIMIGTAVVISWYKKVEGRGSGTPKRPPDADLAGGEA